MKKNVEKQKKKGGMLPKQEVPYLPLKFGYPSYVADEDEDDDDEEIAPSLLNLGQKSPFASISADLYNLDYKNRIIVINEGIDQRCFVYAKMIENWNRMDKRVLDLKAEFEALLKVDPEVGVILGLVGVDSQEDGQERFNALVAKYPVLTSLLGTLTELKIPSNLIMNYEAKPIKIKFNSNGGWMLAYETLADVIKLSKTKVIGINMGMAYSAAAFLLVHCHERLALPNSRMLVHRGSGGNYGSYEETESSQRNYKERVDEMIKSFQKRTKIPSKVLKKNMNPDWYLSAQKALQYGMIDRIVTDIDEII